MDILLTSSKEYFKPMLILINSIFENNKDSNITIHVVHTSLNENDLSQLDNFIKTRGGKLKNYKADTIALKDILMQQRMSIAPFLRLYAIYMLNDIDKVLYLDIDMIVVKSLRGLWETDMQDYYIAAVGNKELYTAANLDSVKYMARLTQYGTYYNSGVMLLQLNKLRNSISLEDLIEYIKKNEIRTNGIEEIIVNLLWNKKIKKLDNKYNVMAVRHKLYPRIPYFDPEETVIWHYMFDTKPWLRYELLQDNAIELWALDLYEKYSNIPECSDIHEEVIKNMCFLNKGRVIFGYVNRLYYYYYFKSQGIHINKFFNDNNYKNIAVYGTGSTAKVLCDELRPYEDEVNIKYFIRTRPGDSEYRGKRVILAQDVLKEEKVDAIIVTTYMEYEGVKAYLQYYGVDVDIISFEEVIFWF